MRNHVQKLEGFAYFLAVVASAWLLVADLAAAQPLAPSGELTDPHIRFQYAVYFLPEPRKPALATFKAVLSQHKAGPQLVTGAMPKSPAKAFVAARLETNVPDRYRAPDLASLQYFGRGMSAQDAQAMQGAKHALVLDFAHPKSVVFQALRMADELVEQVARETGGLIWDEQTREVFTPDAWRKARADTWSGAIPDASKHTIIHAYKNNEFVRAISLGMSKFGLPDVVISDFSWSVNRPMGSLLSTLMQSLVEGQTLSRTGEFQLSLPSLKHEGVRAQMLGSLKAGSIKTADLVIRQGKPEQGDPDNRLIAVGFDRYAGPDVHARYTRLLTSLFGAENSTQRVRHDTELLDASQRAKARLSSLRAAFLKGLAPGEFIQVKAPFRTPSGGNEYMWVEVQQWTSSKIGGMLKNQPVEIPTLKGGQMVEVRQEDVFDFIWTRADGTFEGNETAKILERMRTSNR